MAWAVDDVPLIESRAVMVPLIGAPGGPCSLWEMNANVLLAFLEALLRDTEDGGKQLDKMYDAVRPGAAPASRENEIAMFLAAAAD